MTKDKLEEIIQTLRDNGFISYLFNNRDEFYIKFFQDITDAKTIGIGGSVTIRELKLIERIEEMRKEVVHHWIPGLTEEEDEPIRRKEMACDLFLTSTNALTESGQLINIDGIGNRVAAMIFGPKKVYIVTGVNKIVKDLEAGISRIKNIAAPLNARRVKADVPCAVTGRCEECNSPRRICRVITIHERPPLRTEMRIYLINETLGF